MHPDFSAAKKKVRKLREQIRYMGTTEWVSIVFQADKEMGRKTQVHFVSIFFYYIANIFIKFVS
jgi:hypothetical protein